MICLVFLVHQLSIGGAEKMLVEIVNRLDKKEFRSIVVSLGLDNPMQSSIAAGCANVNVFSRRWRYDLSPARLIRHLIQECHADCVVCFDFYTSFFARMALRDWQGLAPKVFISEHTTIPPTLKERFQTWLYARLLRKEDLVLTVCKNQADYISRVYSIPARQFVTIYNGVDTEFFDARQVKESREAIRRRLSIPADANVILQVANFSPHKSHKDMLAALRILLDSNPELSPFYISVGSGNPERENLIRELANKIGVMDRVLFAGIQKDVRPFYKIATCACLASVAVETFSIAALEAMSMGVPVVLTNLGGANEMVKDGFNGLLVPPRRPELLAKALSSVLSQRGRFNDNVIRQHVIEHFSIQKCVQSYARVLQESV